MQDLFLPIHNSDITETAVAEEPPSSRSKTIQWRIPLLDFTDLGIQPCRRFPCNIWVIARDRAKEGQKREFQVSCHPK